MVPLSASNSRTSQVAVGRAMTTSLLKLKPIALMTWLAPTCQPLRCWRPS